MGIFSQAALAPEWARGRVKTSGVGICSGVIGSILIGWTIVKLHRHGPQNPAIAAAHVLPLLYILLATCVAVAVLSAAMFGLARQGDDG